MRRDFLVPMDKRTTGQAQNLCHGTGRDGILTYCYETGREGILTICPVPGWDAGQKEKNENFEKNTFL